MGRTSHPTHVAQLCFYLFCAVGLRRGIPLGERSVKEKRTGDLLVYAPGFEAGSLILVRAVALTSLVTSDLFLGLFPQL